MKTRPFAVSLIAWFYIITSAVSLLALPLVQTSQLDKNMLEATQTPRAVAFLLSLAGALMNLSAGIGMLQARNWGRKLYLYGTPIVILLGLTAYHFKLVPFQIISSIFYGICLYFLTRQNVQEYFLRIEVPLSYPPAPAQQVAAPRVDNSKRFGSIFLLIFAGGFLVFYLMMLGTLLSGFFMFIFSSLLILAIPTALTLTANWLWGWAQWKQLTGAFFLGVAFFSATMGIMFNFIQSSPELFAANPNMDSAKIATIAQSAYAGAVLIAIVGIVLIVQYRRSKHQQAEVQVTPIQVKQEALLPNQSLPKGMQRARKLTAETEEQTRRPKRNGHSKPTRRKGKTRRG